MALVALGFADRAARLERFGNLVIQFHTISHNHEGPVARKLAQNLLREKDHRKTLAAALSLPKYTAPTMTQLAGFQHRGNGVVNAQILVVLADNLDQFGLLLREHREVLYQVEQPHLVARPANHHLQRY